MKNIIGFNITWFGLVYFGNTFIPVAIIFIVLHLLMLSKQKNEKVIILVVTLIGIATDSLLQYLDILIFIDNDHIPFWLMVLWSCFATTLCHSLRFLSKSRWLQLLAGLSAPFSYIAGYKLGAIELGQSIINTYLILAVSWVTLFILFFHFIKQSSNSETSE